MMEFLAVCAALGIAVAGFCFGVIWTALRVPMAIAITTRHERTWEAVASYLEGLHDNCPLIVQDGEKPVQEWLLEEADRARERRVEP